MTELLMGALVPNYTQNLAQRQLGSVNRQVLTALAVLIAVIILMFQLKSCVDNPPDWFPGKNKQELAVENAQVKKDLHTVIQINESNQVTQETAKDAEKKAEVAIEEVKKETTSTVKKITVIQKKHLDTIEPVISDPTLTQDEKNEKATVAAVDAVWDSYCTIEPQAAGCPS